MYTISDFVIIILCVHVGQRGIEIHFQIVSTHCSACRINWMFLSSETMNDMDTTRCHFGLDKEDRKHQEFLEDNND